MYSLQVKSRLSKSNSSSSSSGSKSIQLEGASLGESSVQYDNDDDLLEDDDIYHDTGRPLTPQSWVQKIGSAMFQKIKIAPSTESPMVVVKPAPAAPPPRSSTNSTPTPPRPSKFQLQINTQPVETRIAMPPSTAHDDADVPKRGSFGQQSIDFIKVYCSPKRQNESPKIQPHREPAASTPVRRTNAKPFLPSTHDDDDDDDDRDFSPSKRPDVRGDVVPVLQSFFARPKPSKDRKTSTHTVDRMIHRQEQYKRDLARHDQLRATAALSAHRPAQPNDDDETAQCRREALRTHARSLKRQRMADIAAAKQVLKARDEQNRRHFQDTRESWECEFEDEVAALAAAFAKASHRHTSESRPMTTAGLVVPEARGQVERDKVLLQLRAQTAPTAPVQAVRDPSRSASPVIESSEGGDDSRPGTSERPLLEGASGGGGGYDWLDRSQSVEAAEPSDESVAGAPCNDVVEAMVDRVAAKEVKIARPDTDDTVPG